MQTIEYGPHEFQVGDLYLPNAARPPVVCLLHGGFWRMPYGREELAGIAEDLAAKGYAVWNIEYRRVGAPGGGWPGTFSDVALAVDHLAILRDEGIDLDLERVVVAGHSAGGQLALCVAAQNKQAQFRPTRVRPMAAAGLAAVANLGRAYAMGSGNGAVHALLEGGPEQVPARYAAVSPIELLPFGVAQLVIHGALDSALPVDLARGYAAAAAAAGDPISFVELADAGHMDFVDPRSAAHAALCQWLERLSHR